MNELKQFDNNVTYHEYVQGNHQLRNVVYHKQGATDKILLFCAHYDTILNTRREDIDARAPGANDNASGVSSLLEISRIISKLDFELSLRFVPFQERSKDYGVLRITLKRLRREMKTFMLSLIWICVRNLVF
jgi:Peptidase family M28